MRPCSVSCGIISQPCTSSPHDPAPSPGQSPGPRPAGWPSPSPPAGARQPPRGGGRNPLKLPYPRHRPALSETGAELIDPLLASAGWGVVEGSRIRREFSITSGCLEGGGQGLRHRHGQRRGGGGRRLPRGGANDESTWPGILEHFAPPCSPASPSTPAAPASSSWLPASSGPLMNRPADRVQLKGRASASTASGAIHIASP